MTRLIICLLLLCGVFHTYGQKKVRLKQADYSRGGTFNGVRTDWVVGNVIFTQNQTTIYCDSAQIFKKENSVQAYGRVRITDDSVTVTARSLRYDGNTRTAFLRNRVVFVKQGTATLYTDNLDYDRDRNEARFFNGGKLVDSTNTLTSKKGYYQLQSNLASFKTDVVAVNPDYTLRSDTLQYNSKTKIVYFQEHTTLVKKDGETAVYEHGFYDTNQKQSTISKGTVKTPTYEMKGDRYFLDEMRKFYKAKDNVELVSKDEDMTIYGDDGDYDKAKGVLKIYGHAYVVKVADDGDTLFMTADTLVALENEDPKKKRILGYPKVRIFKRDMQGTADSLVYFSADSTLFMYKKPALWTGNNQMTSDTIKVTLHNNSIDKIYLLSNSFVISADTLRNFNQIKGRKMVAHFNGKRISHVDVSGNGETIYYALQEEEQVLDSVKVKITLLTGMNRLQCSNMKIRFKAGEIDNVSAYVKPDASFIPPHELTKEVQKLSGFTLRSKERPGRRDE